MRQFGIWLVPLMLGAFSLAPLQAAKEDPVQWALSPVAGSAKIGPGSTAYFELKASIQAGWHLYSPTTPPGGPIITKIKLKDSPAILSYNVYRPQPVRKLDPNFQLETETYSNSAVFFIEALSNKSATGKAVIEAIVRYQACSDTKCLNPVQKIAATEIAFSPVVNSAQFTIPSAYALVRTPAAMPQTAGPTPARSPERNGDLLPFLLTALGFGLAALFTPCVFPMIPITVSFFLNQGATSRNGASRTGWKQALVFCLGIIGLFTGLGFLVTAIAGPFGVVQLGSNPWVNGFIAIVFCIFGLSLLGAFELRLPSGF